MRRDRADQIVEHAFGNDAEQLAHLRVRNFVAGICHGLFEQGEPVAEAAFRRARKNCHGGGFDLEIFRLYDVFDLAGNFLKGESAELKELRARFDRLDQILGASGGQNKNDALWRLLESFQQGVRSLVGKLMGFVEDYDFVAA